MDAIHSSENRSLSYEIKFLIPATDAPHLRAWARAGLGPDENAGSGGDTYFVTSLYFDTADLDVFHRRGSYRRAKYRVRRYGAADTVFLERKLRQNRIVSKRRTLVPIDDLEQLTSFEDSGWAGHWFRRRVMARKLSPVCQISYERMALVGESDSGPIRLTLDQELRARAISDSAFGGTADTQLLEGQAVLELKFRIAMPVLFKTLLSEMRLTPLAFSKYRVAMPVLGLASDVAATAVAGESLAIYA